MAAPPPASLTTASRAPVYPLNLAHNARSLYYVKSTTACLAGTVAGILGLTNYVGFAWFFLTALASGALFALAKQPKRVDYFTSPTEPWIGGILENLFSYVLFWTLFYSLVYIYD
ncbi:hypothetical protein JCM10212_005239 [Sporobolomyces blumeae]